jgi:pre-mRNA-splicing factor SYF2
MGKDDVVAGPAAEGKSQPACINSSNPYHECSDYCLRKIAEARQRLDDELPDSWNRPPEHRTVHPDCINASNPYHDCSEYCFKRIADAKSGGATDPSPFVISFLFFGGGGVNLV